MQVEEDKNWRCEREDEIFMRIVIILELTLDFYYQILLTKYNTSSMQNIYIN